MNTQNHPALNQVRSCCLTLDKQNLLKPAGPTPMKMVDLYLLSLSCGGRAVTEGAKALRPVQGCQRKVESPPPTDRDPLKPPELEGDVVQQSQEASHRSPLTSYHHKNHLWLCLRPCAHLSHGSAQHPQTKLQFHVTLNDFYSSLMFYSVKNPMRLHYLGHLPTG